MNTRGCFEKNDRPAKFALRSCYSITRILGNLMFVIDQLRFAYTANTVLEIPHWQIAQGERCLIVGASGSGKTTLLHLLAGLLTPQQGTLIVLGQYLATLSPSAQDRFRGQNIGVVFQRLHLVNALNVLENLLLAQTLAQLPPDKARALEVLTALNLQNFAQRYPAQLSQGQAQRVALARAIINRPQLILADEPSANLDDAHCIQMLDLLQQHAAQASLVIATHDQRVKNYFQGTRLLELQS